MKNDVKALVAAAIFLTLMFSAVSFDLRALGTGSGGVRIFGCNGAGQQGCWQQAPQGGEDMQSVAGQMFGGQVVPFEVLSMVLLVALVAAIFMARLERPDEEGGDVE